MIELDLQKFAKTKSYMSSYRKSIHEMKQKLSTPGSKEPEEKKKETPDYKKGRLTDADIKRSEEYVFYQVKNANDKNEKPKSKGSGEKIMEMIDDEKIWYDDKKHIWVTPKGNTYVLRKRRK